MCEAIADVVVKGRYLRWKPVEATIVRFEKLLRHSHALWVGAERIQVFFLALVSPRTKELGVFIRNVDVPQANGGRDTSALR